VFSFGGEPEIATEPSSGVGGSGLFTLGAALILFVGETDSGEASGFRSHGRDFLLRVLGGEGGGLDGGGATLSFGGVKPMIV
jgi:hypothetical protein